MREMTEQEQKHLEDLALQDERRIKIKKIALTLLQQCKDENLSLEELESVLDLIRRKVNKVTLRDGLTL